MSDKTKFMFAGCTIFLWGMLAGSYIQDTINKSKPEIHIHLREEGTRWIS